MAAKACVMIGAADAIVRKAPFPDRSPEIQFFLCSKRKTALDVPDCLFQRSVRGGREQEMKVIWHYDELIEQEFPLASVILHYVEQQVGHAFGLKDRVAIERDRGYEKCSDFLWGETHREPGLKPVFLRGFFVGLEGPRSYRGRCVPAPQAIVFMENGP